MAPHVEFELQVPPLDIPVVMSMVPDITAMMAPSSTKRPVRGGSVGLSRSDGEQEKVLSGDGPFRVSDDLPGAVPQVQTRPSPDGKYVHSAIFRQRALSSGMGEGHRVNPAWAHELISSG